MPSTGTIGYRYRFTAPLVEGFTDSIAQRVDELGLTDALVETDNALGSPMSIEVRTKKEAALVRMLLGDEEYAIHKHLTFGTTDRDLVSEVRLMAIEAGITPRVRLTTAMNTFGIDMIQCAMLANEGVLLKNLDGLARNAAGQFTGTPCLATSITAVADIHPLPVPGIAYSVTAPKLKRVVMNGYETVCV